jgi:putative ABC transport system ATP-binding protein
MNDTGPPERDRPQRTSNGPLIETRQLRKVYPDGNVVALAGVNLAIQRSEYLAIMGQSGSGKSTLLSLIGGLDLPTSGQVLYEGRPLAELPNLDAFRARKIGFVFQSFLLLPTLTALENVQVPMFEVPQRRAERARRATELLAQVGLTHRLSHFPTQLSIGERQRVAIARALANGPDVLLADEPTGNLDSRTTDEILHLFQTLHEQHEMTLVVITHSSHVAEQAQRCVHVIDGQLADAPLFSPR